MSLLTSTVEFFWLVLLAVAAVNENAVSTLLP